MKLEQLYENHTKMVPLYFLYHKSPSSIVNDILIVAYIKGRFVTVMADMAEDPLIIEARLPPGARPFVTIPERIQSMSFPARLNLIEHIVKRIVNQYRNGKGSIPLIAVDASSAITSGPTQAVNITRPQSQEERYSVPYVLFEPNDPEDWLDTLVGNAADGIIDAFDPRWFQG